MVCGLDLAGPGQGQIADACKCGNELSGSVRCGEFLDCLQTSNFLKKDFVPCSKYYYNNNNFYYYISKFTYECAKKIFLNQRKSVLRHVSQSESREIHCIDIRATIILGYSDFQDHLPYFNMIHGDEACGVG
jgi:hypothetical protein